MLNYCIITNIVVIKHSRKEILLKDNYAVFEKEKHLRYKTHKYENKRIWK